MTEKANTGVVFIATGSAAGAGVSATVGGIGLAGGFGAVGISAVPVVGAGAVAGAAAYGAFHAIATGDGMAYGAMGIGAVGGIGVSNFVGGMGLVAPKIGLAFGIGTIPMMGVGAFIGLAAYGVAKMLDKSEPTETPSQLFDRMEEKVLQMDFYNEALIELDLFLSGEDLNQKFAALEMEDELQALKAKCNKKVAKASTCKGFEIPEATFGQEFTSLINQPSNTWKCVKILKGHTAPVNAIAFSPTGKIIVSASDDKTVNQWNFETEEKLYSFTGQAGAVLSVAISPDGNTVASGCVDCKISSWHLDTKKYLGIFYNNVNSHQSHNGFVCSLSFSPDGKLVASGSTDKTIRLWERYTKELKRTLNGHLEAVLSIVFSPNSQIMVSGSVDKTIRVWDLNDFTSQVLTGHLGAVKAVVISPDSKTLISGSSDSKINIWCLVTGELLSTLTGHQGAIMSLAISPDGKTLASSTNNDIKLWNLANCELITNLSGCSPVGFSPNGKKVASGGKNETVKIWNYIHNHNDSMVETMLSGTWWEILGVEKDADSYNVKQAYLSLARRYHPDINKTENAKAAMQAINQAYKKFQLQFNNVVY
jgi:WD40 repeat protein